MAEPVASRLPSSAPADGHVPGAEDQAVLHVLQRAHAQVQPAAGRDHRGLAAFHAVVQHAGLDGHVVAVDAPGAQVVQRAGRHVGRAAVDEPAVVQRAAGHHLGAGAADLAAGLVVDVVGP